MASRSPQAFTGDIVGDARRIEARTQLRLSSMLHGEGLEPVAVIVTDVTTRGCRIETLCDVPCDAPVASYVTIVMARSTLVGGRVAWRRDGALGIDFCARMMPKAIARILDLGA